MVKIPEYQPKDFGQGVNFVPKLPKDSWFRRMVKKWRTPRIPSHPDLVMCQYRDSIMLADNRKRELLCITRSEIDGQWKIEIVARF